MASTVGDHPVVRRGALTAVVHEQTGGHGDIAGNGSDASGLQRATAVAQLIRRQLDTALPSSGVPADFSTVAPPTSEGRSVGGEEVGPADEQQAQGSSMARCARCCRSRGTQAPT